MKKMGLLGAFLVGGAWAQEAQSEAVQTGMSFAQAWAYGGWVMWVLAAISVFALALVFWFFVTLREGGLVPHALFTDVVAAVRGGNLVEARRLCDRSSCGYSQVVSTALDVLQDMPTADSATIREAVESEGARQAESLHGQTELLLDVATIAPMVGLLGTVLGMLTAFSSIAGDVASAKPVVLAAGVSQAIVTTVFGLIVAIPSMAFYALFRRRAAKRLSQLEAAASETIVALSSRGIGA